MDTRVMKLTPEVIEKLQDIHDALDRALGDTDPLWIDDDTPDEEIREELPVFWAAKELADLISRFPVN